ncbi:unnamed protein product [Adineta ricciae]|uniref:Uncharacterized protein n=1 Tax=Adineta ricciae TaxID=249248 RepID=A0A815W8T3_ADIRI|nr:unnamed protein product [Adineta ricciae]
MASATVSSAFTQQQPPICILQSWRRQQATPYDEYLIEQPFLIGPDTAVPSSRLRQCFRNVYEQRAKALIIVHRDPWEKIPAVQSIGTSTNTRASQT